MINLTPEELRLIKGILKSIQDKNIPVWAFGSRIKGNNQPYSDLDLVIVGQKRLPLSEYYALKDAFEYSSLSFKVDLLDWNRLSSEFQAIILEQYSVI
jgi:predicted nucleotidyltransferase